MNIHFNSLAAAGVILLGATTLAQAAIIPPGEQLDAKQEFTRNNGSEPESLDPALAESVPANHIARDLFEGLTGTTNSGQSADKHAMSWHRHG